MKIVLNFSVSKHIICLSFTDACFLHFLRQLKTKVIKDNVTNWRIWNIRVLFGLFIFYGLINCHFTALRVNTLVESILGWIIGSIAVFLIFDKDN